MFNVHGSTGAKTVYPGHQMRYDQSALHLMKTIPGCEILATVFKQNRLLPADGVSITTNEQVAGFKSHAADERGISGLHYSDHLNRDTMPSSERGSLGAAESNRTDEREISGLHFSDHLNRDTMPSSERGSLGAAADERGISGLYFSENLNRDTMPMSERGSLGAAESNRTDERGISGLYFSENLQRDTKSCSDRRLGFQNTKNPLMLLRLMSSSKVPVESFEPKYTRNNTDIGAVLTIEQFIKSFNSCARERVRKWKDAAINSKSNSHPFTTSKKGLRPDSALRATDKWELSMHETEEAIKLIAPNATEVNNTDREATASVRAKRKRE